MKKLLMICMIGLVSAMRAYATTMCVSDDILPIVLDPSIASTNYRANTELSEWWVEFSYGTVYGISACVSTPSGEPTDTLIDANTGDIAKGGESLGVNCWCKMTHPVNSRWVFRYADTTVAECRSNCAHPCAYGVRVHASVRTSMFGSVGD